MSNTAIEEVSSGADKAKVALAIALVVAGVLAYYLLEKQSLWVRSGLVVGGLLLGAVVAWTSNPGKRLVAFLKDSWAEAKRVTWPTRKETIQMTWIVFAFVAVAAIFLWVTDKTLEWVLYDLILGWGRR